MSEGRRIAGIEVQKPTKKKIFVYIKLFLSEFFGTAMLLLFGCMGCAAYPTDVFLHAVGFGFAVFVSLQTLVTVSGSHINPSVTIGAVILGKINILRGILYVIAQFLGAMAGYCLCLAVIPYSYRGDHFCVNRMNGDLEVYQGLLIEILITGGLVFTCGGVWDPKNGTFFDSVSIRLGVVILALAMVGAPFSGASMNTARTFGPALIQNSWDNHWIYWVGPNVGAIAAAVIYRFAFENFDDSDELE